MKINELRMLVLTKILKRWNYTIPNFNIIATKYTGNKGKTIGYKIISKNKEVYIPISIFKESNMDEFIDKRINTLIDYWYNIPSEIIGTFNHKIIKNWIRKRK